MTPTTRPSRRGALVLLTGVIAAMTKDAYSQSSLTMFLSPKVPPSLTFQLNAYREYRFILDGKTVTFTPEQIMTALQETK